MPLWKFKTFEDLEKFEREGKGVSWNFRPDETYFRKALRFRIRIPIPFGLFKFRTFEEAEEWEREWWIRNGTPERNPKSLRRSQ
jgi:hypothetical protein